MEKFTSNSNEEGTFALCMLSSLKGIHEVDWVPLDAWVCTAAELLGCTTQDRANPQVVLPTIKALEYNMHHGNIVVGRLNPRFTVDSTSEALWASIKAKVNRQKQLNNDDLYAIWTDLPSA